MHFVKKGPNLAVIVLDEAKKTGYGGNSKNSNYSRQGPILHESEAEKRKCYIYHDFLLVN